LALIFEEVELCRLEMGGLDPNRGRMAIRWLKTEKHRWQDTLATVESVWMHEKVRI
jgi:hypothetical protein